jgi:hypothetical protein
MRRKYHEIRGAIRRRGGKLHEAIADLSADIAIGEQEARGDEAVVAAARGRPGDALVEAGDVECAEGLARQAHEALALSGDPGFARACVTLAMIHRRRNVPADDLIEQALRSVQANPFLSVAGKARELESAARSLESAGFEPAVSEYRAAANAYLQSIGVAVPQEALATSGCD